MSVRLQVLWHRVRGHRIGNGEVVFVYGSWPVTYCSCGEEWQP